MLMIKFYVQMYKVIKTFLVRQFLPFPSVWFLFHLFLDKNVFQQNLSSSTHPVNTFQKLFAFYYLHFVVSVFKYFFP